MQRTTFSKVWRVCCKSAVAGAKAACPLEAHLLLHCLGAARDLAAVPGTAGACGHLLHRDSESQGHLWPLERQAPFGPRELIYVPTKSCFPAWKRATGTGAGGFLPPRGALHPVCCQCRGVLDHLAGATKEKQAFLKSVWLQEGRPGFGSLQLRDLLLLALGGSSSMRILLLLWQKTKYQQP